MTATLYNLLNLSRKRQLTSVRN